MKKINKYGKGLQTLAVILLIVALAGFCGSIILIAYLDDNELYDGSTDFYDSYFCLDTTQKMANEIFYNYFYLTQLKEPTQEEIFRIKAYEKKLKEENSNFFFRITDNKGDELLSSLTDDVDYTTQFSFSYKDTLLLDGDETNDYREDAYMLHAYIRYPITAKDSFYDSYRLFQMLYSVRYPVIALSVFFAALLLFMLYFLICQAGHHKRNAEIVLSGRDKIPFDLYLAGTGMLIVLLFYFWSLLSYSFSYTAERIFGLIGMALLFLLLLPCILTFAARVKKGRWWENAVIYRIVSIVYGKLRVGVNYLSDHMNMVWKIAAGFMVYLLINSILFWESYENYYYYGYVIFLPVFIFNFTVLFCLCYLTAGMIKIKNGGKKIAQGDYHYKIDTKHLLWDFKEHGENLNNIGYGMARAVEESLKSERFKTELITNVSHDIKTPLTSIVNYVDLLKKEKIDNEKIQNYISVLDKQSERLKKLIVDLIEASKASTGNITVNPQRTDIVELINQSLGEYTERFKKVNLELCLQIPDEEVVIFADGKLLWRVFDNLLNNICKYSMPGTRVYLSVSLDSQKVIISLKNISKYALNISTDELLERFVRGDASRNTEGSGLGLAIAKSLTELQKGSFSIYVDGDLFKIVLEFEQKP